jgi:NitT/TauT family transport system ATP-binding protein
MTLSDSTATQIVIEIEGLSKVFENGVEALGGVDLKIEKGSFTALLGPSGCGKSTLLKLVAELAQPSAGTLRTTLTGDGSLGFVFQDATLMPWCDVAANVAMPLELLGLSVDEKASRVKSALGLVGLEDFASTYPRALSGGMKMRVSLARALASRPQVLLLDEPFAALDEITRNKLNDDIIQIAQDEKLTVLFVTHSVFESVYLADRIIVMAPRPGRPIAEFDVLAPSGRDPSFRLSAHYSALCNEVSDAVAMAITEAGGEP